MEGTLPVVSPGGDRATSVGAARRRWLASQPFSAALGVGLSRELEARALAALDCTALELARLTAQPVTLLPRASEGEPLEGAFHVELVAPSGAPIGLAFDAAAVRALADALLVRQVGLRGQGELTSAEQGLLEFAVLCAVDAWNQRASAPLSLRALRFGRETRARAKDGLEAAVDLRVGSGSGEARIQFPAPAGAADEPWRFPSCAAGDVVLRACLATLRLRPRELEALAPGDVVLVDAAERATLAGGVTLVTGNGWQVARAALVADHVSSLTVRPGEFAPVPFARPARAGERVPVALLSGSLALGAEALGQWETTPTLCLVKDEEAPVELVAADGSSFCGEWVKLGAESGLRVWSRAPAP